MKKTMFAKAMSKIRTKFLLEEANADMIISTSSFAMQLEPFSSKTLLHENAWDMFCSLCVSLLSALDSNFYVSANLASFLFALPLYLN